MFLKKFANIYSISSMIFKHCLTNSIYNNFAAEWGSKVL